MNQTILVAVAFSFKTLLIIAGCGTNSEFDNRDPKPSGSLPATQGIPAATVFDSSSWKSQRHNPANRRAMLADLLKDRKLHGKPLSDVFNLLGLPEEIYTDIQMPEIKNGLALHYRLERYAGDFDRQRLIVLVGEDLSVTDVRRTEH